MQAGNLIFGSKADYIVAIASCLITLISVMIALYQSCALGQQADMRRRAAHIYTGIQGLILEWKLRKVEIEREVRGGL